MKKKKLVSPGIASPFNRVPEMTVGNFTISKGDIIKISGEYGTKFKFDSLVTDTRTGSVWVDCFELERGMVTRFRSFAVDRVKRVPTRRKNDSRK